MQNYNGFKQFLKGMFYYYYEQCRYKFVPICTTAKRRV